MLTKKQWNTIFLSSIALTILLELFAVFDNNPNTSSLTQLVVTNIPELITMPALIGIFLWFIAHFIKHYNLNISKA